MALGLNHVLLIGTLVREPDLRYTPSGLAVLRLDLGGDDHVHDEAGVLRTRPWYHRATVFGTQAERVVDVLHAGSPLWLEGHLEQRRWENDEGQARSSLEVVGRRVEVLEFGPRGEDDPVALDARDQPRLRDATNHVRLIGNLVRDVDLHRTDGGARLARLSLAVRERTGDDAPAPHFVDVQAWRDLARALDGWTRGTPVYLEGRLASHAWTDGDGVKQRRTRVEATRVEQVRRPVADRSTPTPVGSTDGSEASANAAGPPF